MGLLDTEVAKWKRSFGLLGGIPKTFKNNPRNAETMDAVFGFGGIIPGVGDAVSAAEAKYRYDQGDMLGAGLAGLAGVIGGSTYLTEPAMASTVGSIIFVVVVVGGMGSLSGAFLASLLIGVIQTFAVAFDYSVATLAHQLGLHLSDAMLDNTFVKMTLSQVAPILPYLFLVLILIFRPKGLLGTREG